MNAEEKTVWLDKENKILSFRPMEHSEQISKAENLFWDYIIMLIMGGYRIL